jgi:hypothetical protein
MTFTEKQEESIKKMPMIESFVSKSKDGKFVIHKTVMTHIKPIQYWQAVIEGKETQEELIA